MQKKKVVAFFYLALFLLPLLFITNHCGAQAIPSFKKGTDTAAINRLIRSANTQANPDSSIQKFKQAAQMSIDADYYIGAAKTLIALGSRISDRGDYPEALKYAQQALPYAQKAGDTSQLAFCYNLFGVIDFLQGNYVPASESYFKALDVLKNIDSTKSRAAISIYTNLATVSSRMEQNDKMLFYLNQGEILARRLRIAPAVGNILLAGILLNKGNFFERTLVPDSAIKYYTEVLDIANNMDEKNGKRIRFLALAESDIAAADLQTGEYEKAAAYCRQAIAQVENKIPFIAISASYTLGEALRNMKQYKEAEAVVLSALKTSAASNIKDQTILGYVTLVKVYKDTKQFEKALDCMDSVVALKDTLVNAEKTKAVSQVEARYNMADKDRQITRNELLIAQQKNKIAMKNLWIGGIIGGVLLLSVLSIGFYFISRQKQAAIIKSLKQENTISILKGVVQGEENERIRLARDLHDGIGGMLSATKMRFMSLRHDNEELTGSPKYLEAMGLLDIMGDEIRKTSHNLMPEALLKQDLAEALRTYCNNIQAGTELHIDFQSFGTFDDLPNDFKLNAYRIVQELLKNTLQHAKATYAIVQLMMLEAYMTISVEDNGAGFNTGETKDGIGLHNLKSRVLSHNGHYTLKSEPGKGTTVYIEFERPGSRNNS